MRLGPMELAVIVVLVLILFGAGRLPQVFEQLGKGIRAFRDSQKDHPSRLEGDARAAEWSDAKAEAKETERV